MFGNLLKSKSMSFTNKSEVNVMGVSPAVARFVWNEDIWAAYQKKPKKHFLTHTSR